jgi:16S rRNA (guanine(966)-N(2))-methyltransferase RsmD
MPIRIGAGDQKGRALRTPKRAATRPTSSRVRAALFNILGDRILQATWLDLFAGSGATGLEALCRGAAWATFVEAQPEAGRCISDNIKALGYADRAHVWHGSVRQFLRAARRTPPLSPFDLVFADPPYDDGRRNRDALEQLLLLCRRSDMIAPHAWLILEHAAGIAAPAAGGRWQRARTYTYGDSALTIYHPQPAASEQVIA